MLKEAIRRDLEQLSETDRIAAYFFLKDELQQRISTPLKSSISDIRSKNGAQSCAFMVDMLPHIWQRLSEERRYTSHTWLDVGPGAGYGASFLADLHSSYTLGYRLEVSTIDIRADYVPLMQFESNNIKESIVGDIYQYDQTFDYISASHVIEHVHNPAGFLRRLQSLARKRVFVLTPWKERLELLTAGHQNIFDETFLSELGNPEYKLLTSVAWGAFLEPKYQMLFLDLPGNA